MLGLRPGGIEYNLGNPGKPVIQRLNIGRFLPENFPVTGTDKPDARFQPDNPGTFTVPLSRRSGSSSGWFRETD